MTKRNNGPQQIGDLVGGLIVKAQAKAEDKTRKGSSQNSDRKVR